MGSYQCVCKAGFCSAKQEEEGNITTLPAAIVEEEYSKKVSGLPNSYETLLLCLPCKNSQNSIPMGSGHHSEISGLEVPIVLVAITSVTMVLVVILMALTYKNRQNKVGRNGKI